jgi:hypothetical protein
MTSFGAKSHSELVAVPTFRTGGSDMASVRATCPAAIVFLSPRQAYPGADERPEVALETGT